MLVFIDFVEPSGRYRPSGEPAYVHPEMPSFILSSAVFLDSSGAGDRVPGTGIFHVEGDRFIGPDSLASSGVGELDTLVVVNCDRVGVGAPDQLALGWHATGGLSRRMCAAGLDVSTGIEAPAPVVALA